MHNPLNAMILGGCLVLAGFGLGRMNAPVAPTAHAQAVVPEAFSPFATNNPAIITSSDDGLTLHIWSRADRNDQLWERRRPVYVDSVRAPRQNP